MSISVKYLLNLVKNNKRYSLVLSLSLINFIIKCIDKFNPIIYGSILDHISVISSGISVIILLTLSSNKVNGNIEVIKWLHENKNTEKEGIIKI